MTTAVNHLFLAQQANIANSTCNQEAEEHLETYGKINTNSVTALIKKKNTVVKFEQSVISETQVNVMPF